jgi:hypothetical protein
MLLTQGKSARRIAQELGLSPSTTRRDVRALREQWRRERGRDFDDWVAQQLKEISLGLQEAWRGWRLSLEPNRKVSTKSKGLTKKPTEGKKVALRADDVLEFEQATAERTTAGDPRYLELIERLLGARARLLGLNQPIKIAPTNPAGDEPYLDVRERLLQVLEQRAQHLSTPIPLGVIGAGEQPVLAPAPVEVVEQTDGSFSVDDTGSSGEVWVEVPEGFRLR